MRGRTSALALVLVAALLLVTALCAGCMVEFARRPSAADPLGWPVFPEAPVPAAGAAGRLPVGALQAVLDGITDIGRDFPDATSGASGATAAVLTPQGAWFGAAGVDGRGAPVGTASRLGLGDLTITVTAAEVLHLAAAGRIGLDDPIAPAGATGSPAPAASVRETLAMRGGLGDPTPEQYADLAARVATEPGRAWTRADAIALLPAGPPVPAPAYSSLGYVMLADAVERATGMPFWRAVERDLLEPAGLGAISADGPVAAPGGTSFGLGGPAVPPVLAATSGATGLAADAGALARWGWELYGARLLPPAAVADMTRPAGPGRVNNLRYGLGTMLFSRTVATGDAVGHTGRSAGYSCILVVEPGAQVSIALMAVGGGKNLGDEARSLFLALGRR